MAVERQFDQKWKPTLAGPKEPDNQSSSFDCNICLDFADEPVVTLCGHLYCWPCIFKWFHVQSSSLPPDEYPHCPICKAEISHTTVVPLYGRGQSSANLEHEATNPSQGTYIPPRPPACGTRALLNAASQPSHQLLPYRNPYQPPNVHSYRPEEVVSASSSFNHTSEAVSGVFQPMVGMFGEMVYSRVFGNSRRLYTYPNSYSIVGSGNPRLRRQEMQVDKSLSKVHKWVLYWSYDLRMPVQGRRETQQAGMRIQSRGNAREMRCALNLTNCHCWPNDFGTHFLKAHIFILNSNSRVQK